jgi:hypothetical protein
MSRIFNFHGSTTLVGIRLLIVEVTRSHSNTPHSVGLHWTSDGPVAETSTWQHTMRKRQTFMPPAGFEPAILLGERPQTHSVDRAATGLGEKIIRIGKCELSKSKLRNFLQAPVNSSLFQPCPEKPSVCAKDKSSHPYKLIYLILYFSRYVSRHMMGKRKFNCILTRILPDILCVIIEWRQ